MIFELSNKIKELAANNIADMLALANETGDVSRTAEKPICVSLLASSLRDKNLRETAHSRILYDLLQDKHLQKDFINYFFPEIGITDKSAISIPYPDYKRIDLTLKGEGFFIIVENKINGACEQEKQIKRYIDIAKREYPTEKIYVLYMNGETNDEPSEKSLPHEYRSEISGRLTCVSYKYDIMKWLEKAEADLEYESQPYLKSGLTQYRLYLEQSFRISKLDKNMKTQIDNVIKEHLALADMPINKQIEKLKDALEDANQLYEHLEQLLDQYEERRRKELYSTWFKLLDNEMSKQGIALTKEQVNEIGFDFIYKRMRFRCCISDEKVYNEERSFNEVKYYWGINSLNGKINEKVFDELRNIVLNGDRYLQNDEGNAPSWVASDYAPTEEIPEIFIYLAKTILGNTNVSI